MYTPAPTRQAVENQLRSLLRLRTDEAIASGTCMALLADEIAALESSHMQLQQDNALLTAAACRLHEKNERDSVELLALRQRVAQLERVSNETKQMASRGAELAEERFRSAERRRTVDVGLLSAELKAREEATAALVASQQLHTLRLLADGRCATREVARLEEELESQAMRTTLEALGTQLESDASRADAAREIQCVTDSLRQPLEALREVSDALRIWEASDIAERAHASMCADRLSQMTMELDRGLCALDLREPGPSARAVEPPRPRARHGDASPRPYDAGEWLAPNASPRRTPGSAAATVGGRGSAHGSTASSHERPPWAPASPEHRVLYASAHLHHDTPSRPRVPTRVRGLSSAADGLFHAPLRLGRSGPPEQLRGCAALVVPVPERT